MNEVERVALWAGLMASIFGIGLSGVAIWLSIHFSTRADEVSDSTIRALQKIETAVDRQSDDTRELIKAAWDKMIGGLDRRPDQASTESTASEIASGLSAELFAELQGNSRDKPGADQSEVDRLDRLESLLANLEYNISNQLRILARSDRPGAALDEVLDILSELPPSARELLKRLLSGRHLTRDEYQLLKKEPEAGRALQELRTHGFIVPLRGIAEDGSPLPVYWIPSNLLTAVRSGVALLDPTPTPVQERVELALREIGYGSDEL